MSARVRPERIGAWHCDYDQPLFVVSITFINAEPSSTTNRVSRMRTIGGATVQPGDAPGTVPNRSIQEAQARQFQNDANSNRVTLIHNEWHARDRHCFY